MRSTNNYPALEQRRNDLEVRPFRYQTARGRNAYRLEDWIYRHDDVKHKAMVDQKREPMAYAGTLYVWRNMDW